MLNLCTYWYLVNANVLSIHLYLSFKRATIWSQTETLGLRGWYIFCTSTPLTRAFKVFQKFWSWSSWAASASLRSWWQWHPKLIENGWISSSRNTLRNYRNRWWWQNVCIFDGCRPPERSLRTRCMISFSKVSVGVASGLMIEPGNDFE